MWSQPLRRLQLNRRPHSPPLRPSQPRSPQPKFKSPARLQRKLQSQPPPKFSSQSPQWPHRRAPRVIRTRRRQRPHCRPAAWSCPRPVLVPSTRRPLSSRLPLFREPEIRQPALASSVASPSSIAALPEAPEAIPNAACRVAQPERQASSPADLAPSTPRALRPAAMQAPALVDPVVLAHVPALELALDSAAHLVRDLERVLARAVHHRLVKRRVRSARPTNAPVAALRSIPRPRKAQ